MKVAKLIEELKNYNENEEILVLYFDKESTADYLEQEITPEQWATTVIVTGKQIGRAHV